MCLLACLFFLPILLRTKRVFGARKGRRGKTPGFIYLMWFIHPLLHFLSLTAGSLHRLYDFDCVRTPSKAHSDQFRCSSRFAEDEAKQKIMVTDFRSHTMRQETRDVREGLHLFALAMLYTAPATAVCLF